MHFPYKLIEKRAFETVNTPKRAAPGRLKSVGFMDNGDEPLFTFRPLVAIVSAYVSSSCRRYGDIK
jgi:hypothetical protein